MPTEKLVTEFSANKHSAKAARRTAAVRTRRSSRRSFPGPGGQYQISRNGGWAPKWRADGKEIFFLALDGTMMAADVALGKEVQATVPSALFQTSLLKGADRHTYDVTKDGKRFILRVPDQRQTAVPINVVLNWPALAKK